jgi:pimeloyl-ACP methyl ester carboxylesterase
MTDPTFVLVPGAGGSAWTWHLVAAELERRGRSVVSVDLPGDDERAGLPEYVDLVVEAAEGHGDVVLVALSLGGFSASLACPRLPVVELVLVNAMVPAPGESAGEWWGAVDQNAARRAMDVREGRDPDAPYDPSVTFFHDVPADVAAAAAENDRDETGTVFETAWNLPAWPDVPTRVLAAADDRCFPLDLQRRVSEERLGITPEVIPGGHLAPLSQPVELVDRLLAASAPR